MSTDKYQTCIADVYETFKIKEFNFVQFSSQEDIVSNSIGLLDYLQEVIASANFKSPWKWLNIVFKHYSGEEFFNLMIGCQSIAEFAEKIEFDGRITDDFKQLYINDRRSLSEAIIEEARALVLLIRILIDEEMIFSAAYFRIGIINSEPFASFELFDESNQRIDGESKTEFIEYCMNKYHELNTQTN